MWLHHHLRSRHHHTRQPHLCVYPRLHVQARPLGSTQPRAQQRGDIRVLGDAFSLAAHDSDLLTGALLWLLHAVMVRL